MLLGKNRSGGVYEGLFVVPGGGVDEGETKLQALRREMLEETGIDIQIGRVSELNISKGEHEKTLQETGERVLVLMDFFDYRVDLPHRADEIVVRAEDDWSEPQWVFLRELGSMQLGPAVRNTLVKSGIITN
jgi:8-oxo-dGTP pyrophosphatase MutT (NUDIX family)